MHEFHKTGVGILTFFNVQITISPLGVSEAVIFLLKFYRFHHANAEVKVTLALLIL